MTDCTQFERHFEDLVAGELDEMRRDELALHVAECASCCELYDLHSQLAESEIDEPRSGDLRAMRDAVRTELERRGRRGHVLALPTRHARSPKWRAGSTRRLMRSPGWLATLAAIAVIAIGVAGFLTGQRTVRWDPPSDTLLADLEMLARNHRSFADAEGSPYLFSNVRLRPSGDGSVALSFEVSTHLEVRRPAQDPLVREVLVQSLLDRSSIGARLDALELAPSVMDPKVNQAILHTLRRDANQAVRLRALGILAQQPATPEVVAAFVEVLENDESVQMRLLAIDYLGASGMSPETLRGTILESQSESAIPALLARAHQSINF